MRPSNHEAFSRKNILLASTKPPSTNTPDNFEHVADHLTSPAMNFRPVILKKKYCYLREFTAESSLMKNILLASTKPPWTNTPDNFEHVADHLTSPAMNFRPVILKKKYCYLREFTAESSLIFTINPSDFTLF